MGLLRGQMADGEADGTDTREVILKRAHTRVSWRREGQHTLGLIRSRAKREERALSQTVNTHFGPWSIPQRVRGIMDLASYHHVKNRDAVLAMRTWALRFCSTKLGPGVLFDNSGSQAEACLRNVNRKAARVGSCNSWHDSLVPVQHYHHPI